MSWLAALALALVIAGCGHASKEHDTNVEIVQVQRFGRDTKAGAIDLELRFSDCPGDARRVVRADAAFAACIGDPKAGDKLPVRVKSTWSAEREAYRANFVRIGACPITIDPKEEANYEMVQICTDVTMSGAVVGVHCDRTRPEVQVKACPWLAR